LIQEQKKEERMMGVGVGAENFFRSIDKN